MPGRFVHSVRAFWMGQGMSRLDPNASGNGRRSRWLLALAPTMFAVAALILIVWAGVGGWSSYSLETSGRGGEASEAMDPRGSVAAPGDTESPTGGGSRRGGGSAGGGDSPSVEVPSEGAEVPPVEWPAERINILLLGVDQRSHEASMPSRSDTIILVSIDPSSQRVAMISIPRDLYVEIPGYGLDRINHSHAYGDAQEYPGGGPALVMETLEHNFGLEVDYYAQVEFEGFKQLVDTLGGVTVDVESPIIDPDYPVGNGTTRVYIPAGTQHLDGDRALIFARSRHGDSDFGRSARQQQLLLAILDGASRFDSIPKLPSLLGTLRDMVETDIPPLEMLRLARLATEIEREQVSTLVIGPEYVTPFRSAGGADLLKPNIPKIIRAMANVMGVSPRSAQPLADGARTSR